MTISRLFSEEKLKIPMAIITDGDPEVITAEGSSDTSWRSEIPKKDPVTGFEISTRVRGLKERLANNNVVDIFHSRVTLEYDLACAGEINADVICEAWRQCFDGEPRTLNKKDLERCGDNLEERALTVWRGICRANSTRGKSELAQQLAELLEEKDDSGSYKVPLDSFVVPVYIKEAIECVTRRR